MAENSVQRQAYGFLDLIFSKGIGRTPNDIGSYLAPTIEMRPFYEASALSGQVVDTLLATNVGDTAEALVPQGEAWLLKVIGVVASTFSGAVAFPVRIETVLIVDPAAAPCMPDIIGTINAANDQMAGGIIVPQPTILPPGGRIVARLKTDLGAVTFTMSLRLVFARLRA